MDFLTLTCHNTSRNKNNRKATHSFAPGPLTFKLSQEIWKPIAIFKSWSSPKTDLKKNFSNLENRSFQYFFSIVTYIYYFNWTKEHPLKEHRRTF